MVKSVSTSEASPVLSTITDVQFRVSVVAAGAALVAGILAARCCGSLSLPPKPPPPEPPSGTSSELLTRSSVAPSVYQDFVAKDAAAAGVPRPTLAELSRKLVYRVDDVRHVLEVGEPALDVAGVRIRALHVAEGLALEIVNATGADIAYHVVTAPISSGHCNAASVLPFNAMTIGNDRLETRVECDWHDGIAIAVTRVETLEVLPLSAWYLDHVPPSVVGIEPRILRGHRPPGSPVRCAPAVSQAVRSGLERGEIGWRDLADFYARHRCETYQFPYTYRAFRIDDERSLPAVSTGM
jgi:hypothetical protein